MEQRLHESPDDANALFLSSQIHGAFGDRTSPLVLAERAVKLDGNVARYHRQIAEIQGVMAQHSGVFQTFGLARRFRKEIDTALELDPKDTQAHHDLLEYYLLAPGIVGGDPKKADGVARQIAAISEREGYLAAARIAEFHKDAAAMETALRHAVELPPPSYKATMVLATFRINPAHRDEAEAATLARTAIEMDSRRVEAYGILASIYAGRSEWSALDALFAKAAEAVPDDWTPYYCAAERLLTDNHDLRRAEQCLHKYLSQDSEGNQPTASDAHWKLGLVLQAAGQKKKAAQEYTTAVELDPLSPAAHELKRLRSGSGGAN